MLLEKRRETGLISAVALNRHDTSQSREPSLTGDYSGSVFEHGAHTEHLGSAEAPLSLSRQKCSLNVILKHFKARGKQVNRKYKFTFKSSFDPFVCPHLVVFKHFFSNGNQCVQFFFFSEWH